MYVRPSNTGARAIKLPENYSGNAFSNHSLYSDMPPPARSATRADLPYEPPARHSNQAESTAEDSRAEHFEPERLSSAVPSDSISDQASSASSIFTSLLPRSDLSRHFPFGHGIGSEELIILAVMLMVFLSGNEKGEVDSEFLLLLGLLLFAG